MKPEKPLPKPLHQVVAWDPGTVVRGILIAVGSAPHFNIFTVATFDGTIQEFIAPKSLARQLEDAPSGALVSITYEGRDVFRAQWKTFGHWQSITKKRLTLRRPDGSIKVIQRPDWSLSALTSRTMSMGARIERVLASRLAELERLLDDKATPELWDEYYRAVDLWLRSRAPLPSTPPITKAQLNERATKPR